MNEFLTDLESFMKNKRMNYFYLKIVFGLKIILMNETDCVMSETN